MGQFRYHFFFLVLVCLIVIILSVVLFSRGRVSETTVAFLDVGQGDAILISEGGYQVLIDGGADGTLLLSRLGQFVPFWDRTIDVVVATHPDKDHIGGLVDVFSAYFVNTVLMTNVNSDSSVFGAFEERVLTSRVVDAFWGRSVVFPSGARLEVIYPFHSLPDEIVSDTNATSVATVFRWKDETFLFTGDLPSFNEDSLSVSGVDILKAGHHGSRSSTSEWFLSLVRPRDVIFSVGKDNQYGHPAPDVLDRVRSVGAEIFRTDVDGSVVYTCQDSSLRCTVGFE